MGKYKQDIKIYMVASMFILSIFVGGFRVFEILTEKPITYVEYKVQEGDTLYGIAEQKWNREDLQFAVEMMIKENGIKGHIYPGDVILVPVKSKK